MNEKQKFEHYLKTTRDFTGDFLFVSPIVPHCYKTREGDIVLLGNIHVCMFSGSDCKEGDIGCLTIYFNGSKRKKYCRTIIHGAELLKVAKCPKDAKEAIAIYEQWITKTNDITNSYKMIA